MNELPASFGIRVNVEELRRRVACAKPKNPRFLPSNQLLQGCQAQRLQLHLFVKTFFMWRQGLKISG
jgi:hypothetical protein